MPLFHCSVAIGPYAGSVIEADNPAGAAELYRIQQAVPASVAVDSVPVEKTTSGFKKLKTTPPKK